MSSVFAGNPLQLEAHVLHPHTLHLQAKWQLPGCVAAAVSPNGCTLATVHQPTDQHLSSLHQPSSSVASHAVNESLKQEPATQRPAEPEAVSQQPAEHESVSQQPAEHEAVSRQPAEPEAVSQQPAEREYADPVAVDLPGEHKVSMHPLVTRADTPHQPLIHGAAANMPTAALTHLSDSKPAIWCWSSRQHMSISSGLPPWEAPVVIAKKRKLFFSFRLSISQKW